MNFVLKLICCVPLATVFAFAISMTLLFVLSWIINIYKLHNVRDIYWVCSSVLYAFFIIWVILFGYLMLDWNNPNNNSEIVSTALVNRKSLPEPIHYFSTNAKGTVESIHIGGRTEVVPVVQVELTKYFHEENLWVLGGGENNGIVQPEGRKNYFIPVLSGTLNTKWGSAQLFEASQMENDSGTWSEFKVANIAFKNDKPVAVHFRHYNYKNNQWVEAAGYEAFFEEVK